MRIVTLSAAMHEAERLAAAYTGDAGGDGFTLPQTFIHCAQSIEFSVQGFPEPKPAWFQHTAGALAFRVFSMRGQMSHNLAEGIPGAPIPDSDATAEQALARLTAAVELFTAADVVLKPHFAYGMLGREQYHRAHAMHLANHFSSIES